MAKFPGKRPRQPLPTPEMAEAEANAHLDHGPSLSEAEQALALVAPSRVHPVTGLTRPWEPAPNETAAEYVAFQSWLLTSTATPKHALATRMKWEQRRIAYEASGHYLTLNSPEALQDLSLRCVQLALMWGLSELSKHVANAASTPQPAASTAEAMRVVKDAALLSRLLTGLSTENVSIRGTVDAYNLDEMSEGDLAQLKALLTKAKTPG